MCEEIFPSYVIKERQLEVVDWLIEYENTFSLVWLVGKPHKNGKNDFFVFTNVGLLSNVLHSNGESLFSRRKSIRGSL